MTILIPLCLAALFLAYTNGANDNFKGVATLYGCDAASYRTTITLATVATFAGSISSIYLAAELIKTFSGAGVVPHDVAASPLFVIAVGLGAAATVGIATLLGLPISTTHAITGAIIGAGLITVGREINLGVLGKSFIAPLLISPLVAIALTFPLYRLFHKLPGWLGIGRQTCVCLGAARFVAIERLQLTPGQTSYAIAHTFQATSPIVVMSETDCRQKYQGRLLGVAVQQLMDGAHYVSAAAVSFARGLNDTPKILALLLVAQALDIRYAALGIAIAMGLGGILNGRKVARTMSKRISRMNDGQALTANLVTAFLVIVASRLGLPVSTTHVSVGAITGVGIINKSAQKEMISRILASWLITIPVAALLSSAVYLVARLFF
jgi:PiT family inorganic phosphate transporter